MFYSILGIGLFLSILDFIPNNDKILKLKKIYMYIFIFFISFIEGTRLETGTDWIPYHHHFYNPDAIEYLFNFEIGYLNLVNIFKKYFSNNYIVFLFFLTIIKNFITYLVIFRMSEYSFFSVVLYFSSTLGIMGANRQLIALSLSAIALEKLYKKKYIKVVVLILLGYLFHRSILVVFPICLYWIFFSKLSITDKNIIKKIICSIVFMIFFKFIFFLGWNKILLYTSFIFKNGALEKIKVYSLVTQGKVMNCLFGITKNLIILGVMYLSIYNFKFKNEKSIKIKKDFLIKGYLCGIAIYVLFYGQFQIIVERGSFYILIYFSSILLGYILINQKNNYIKILVFIFLILYTIFSFEKSIVLYKDLFMPYKSIFYNTSFKRKLY